MSAAHGENGPGPADGTNGAADGSDGGAAHGGNVGAAGAGGAGQPVARQAPGLYLPGRFAEEQRNQQRPLDYAGMDARGRITIIANARDYHARIPVDELRDMLRARQQKAVARGDAQRAADVNAALMAFWEERKNWVVHRRRNAIRLGWRKALEHGQGGR